MNKKTLKELVVDDLEAVFTQLESLLNEKSLRRNEILNQRGRYKDITRNYLSGVTDENSHFYHISKIRFSLLNIIDQINEIDIKPGINFKFEEDAKKIEDSSSNDLDVRVDTFFTQNGEGFEERYKELYAKLSSAGAKSVIIKINNKGEIKIRLKIAVEQAFEFAKIVESEEYKKLGVKDVELKIDKKQEKGIEKSIEKSKDINNLGDETEISKLIACLKVFENEGETPTFSKIEFESLINHFQSEFLSYKVNIPSGLEIPLYLDDYSQKELLLDKAVMLSDLAISRFKDDVVFYKLKAESLIMCKKFSEAFNVIEIAGNEFEKNIDIELLRCEILASLGSPKESLERIEELKIGTSEKKLIKILITEALIYDNRKEYNKMYLTLESVLKLEPTNNNALSRMWYVVEYARKHQESIKLHSEIVATDPFNSLAWYNLAASYAYLCEYDRAIKAYENAYHGKLDFEYAYRECAEVCLLVNDNLKANYCLQVVLEKFGADSDLHTSIGKCYVNLNRFELAKQSYLDAIKMDEKNSEAWSKLGWINHKQGNITEAINAIEKAIELESFNEDYYSMLAEVLTFSKDFSGAEANFRKAANAAPEMSEHWISLILLLIKLGKAQEALIVIEEAEENTFGVEFLYLKSVCFFKQNKKPEALLTLEEALYEDFDAHKIIEKTYAKMLDDEDVIKKIKKMGNEGGI